ncbi:DUF4376 domain-containing protein [Chromohalobacter nigrandesensis]|uniref:DUF4376 domain-containing protein n=1 Tax=Chromohalobacter nigrandesensis TaxID=119863 RepID=UPI001FF20EA8|nr:DUF4376 domain-containing protein [Chromohalobacter nigrandesensis]MCK0744112.1 DUF4376 domain-containing protein [Chromohalobacter nigrandesensis]
MWARINNNGIVTEITDIDPTGRFHPSLTWIECGDDVRPRWHYDGEAFSAPPSESLADLAQRKRHEIDAARDQAFATGLDYDIAGEPDVVQTRAQDQINLLGLRAKAESRAAAGVTDAVMEFRGKSNVTHQLTPEDMIALTTAALDHIEGIYKRSWERKDAVDAALENEDREGIEAVAW